MPKKTTNKKAADKNSMAQKLSPIKGRPMLQWVGKRTLSQVTAFPAQHIETFNPEKEKNNAAGRLYHGDNKEVLAHLLANGYRGEVNIIYIDPPFDSGADYVRKVQLRGKSAVAKIEGEAYSLGEQVQYTDIWANDNYLQFMYERLILLKELLAEDGLLLLHCDDKKGHFLRCLMEEVFGGSAFVNEIIWHYPGRAMHLPASLNRKHDTIFAFKKTDGFCIKNASDPWTREEFIKAKKQAVHTDENGREFIYQDESGGESHAYKRYLDDVVAKGKAWEDVWKMSIETSSNKVRTDYPTQKPEKLIARFIQMASKPNDLVLDCFIGSGTTAAVAQKLGRRWIGADINKGAIQTTSKRLQGIIADQIETRRRDGEELIPADDAPPAPAASSFHIYRVNDYDLQIQHNEAVNLVCEHIGVERRKDDAYFDGIQGKRLVKVIPFNHPLSPADLEQLKDELKARPEEERDILIVALGKEQKIDNWLADWNRLRKRGDVPNKIEVIELRTDAKYGKFLEHKPCVAKISSTRDKDEVTVTVEDFASPTILERLDSQNGGLLTAQIKDWRAMIDCILIDTDYDGETFNITLTDLPSKKADLVTGRYTFPASKKGTIAIKIIDMLGEELIEIMKV